MNINMIWAQAHNRVIGMNGIMPWHLPEDLAHFKQVTQGHPVIMGRKTWDSLPERFRPLPLRRNIVLTRQTYWGAEFSRELVIKANSLEAAITPNRVGRNVKDVWVIGGGQVYAQYLPLAARLEITEIDAVYEGDTTAPELSADWIETQRIKNTTANGLRFDFVTYYNSRNQRPTQSTLLL